MAAIVELDPARVGEDELAAIHRLRLELEAVDHPGDPPPSAASVRAELCCRPPSEPLRLWVAHQGGDVVGMATAELPRRGDNAHLGTATASVAPTARRRRLGVRLLGEAVAVVAEDGRTVLDAVVRRGSAGVPFATALGYEEKLVEVHRRLHLERVDRALLERWRAEPHPGYELAAWEDRCPEELLEGFAAVRLVMNDAPLEDFELEPEVSTPQLVRDREAANEAAGHWRRTVCARASDGALVGYTSVGIEPGEPWRVDQGGTAVAREHRGHGLGRWMKAEMALWLLDHRPDARVVVTGNAGSNEHMVAINAAMGFEVTEEWGAWQAPLAEVEARLRALGASATAKVHRTRPNPSP